jgi:hypothetical protein
VAEPRTKLQIDEKQASHPCFCLMKELVNKPIINSENHFPSSRERKIGTKTLAPWNSIGANCH